MRIAPGSSVGIFLCLSACAGGGDTTGIGVPEVGTATSPTSSTGPMASTGPMTSTGAPATSTASTTASSAAESTTSSGGSEDADPSRDVTGCEVGTLENCTECGDACENPNPASTAPLCGAAGCDFTCVGEFYDINGEDLDGCESEDVPVQDAAKIAVGISLPDTNDPTFMSNPLNVVGFVYGDSRTHEAPLEERPLGREDWYAVTAVGTGVDGGMLACLGITNFPADNRFEVCISNPGLEDFPQTSCTTVAGMGESACVSPPNEGDAGGPYFVRVQKTQGDTWTSNGYALFLQH